MSAEERKNRTHLPMRNTSPKSQFLAYDAKDPDSKTPPIVQLRPPKGAPNVLLIMLDDAGFGSSSAFGGPCQTPTAEMLATGGLKFNRFHTTALCSPTRQALLTGRNHHAAGMGGITEIATGAPGYCSVRPNNMSPLAKTLKLNGYNTAMFGKCHEVPVWQTSPVGPFDAWPAGGGGFEYFYGFIGGEANQWYPSLYEGLTPVENKKRPKMDIIWLKIWRIRPRNGLDSKRPWRQTSRSSSISRPARPMRRTMYRKSGLTSTRASLMAAGTSCVKRPSPVRRNWA